MTTIQSQTIGYDSPSAPVAGTVGGMAKPIPLSKNDHPTPCSPGDRSAWFGDRGMDHGKSEN